MSTALLGLPRMPYLKSLHISHLLLGMEPTSFAGHHQFLETHQSQLQRFTFDFVGQSPALNIAIPDEFFNQEWCRVLLPELLSLSLQFHRFIIPSSEAAIPYMQRHIPTVETLIIHALQFSYEQISSILKGPTPGGYQLTRLRILDIQIWCFSPAFLSLLVRQAPHLQSLKLTASVVGPDKQPARFGRNRVPEFCEALKSSYFPDWGLYELQLSLLPPSSRNQCKVALFRALPKLKKFCGLTSEESWSEERETELSLWTTSTSTTSSSSDDWP